MAGSILILLVGRVLILFFLVPALWIKVSSPRRFEAGLRTWRVLPLRAVRAGAFCVIAAEILVVFSLASGIGLSLGAMVGAWMFGAFAAGASSVVWRGIATSCSCFSLDLRERVSWLTAARSATLALVCGTLAWSASPALLPARMIEVSPALTLLPVFWSFRYRVLQLPSGARAESA